MKFNWAIIPEEGAQWGEPATVEWPGSGYTCSAFLLGSAVKLMHGSLKERAQRTLREGSLLGVLLGGLPGTVGAISLSGRPAGPHSSQTEVLSVPGQGTSSSKTAPSSSISLGPGC